MIRSVFIFLALIAAVAPAVADTTCPSNARGCNAPMMFSNLTASKTLPTIVVSTGITQDFKDKLDEGHQVLINFAGGATPTTAYILETGGTDAAYADFKTKHSQQTDADSSDRLITQAKNMAADGEAAFKGGGGRDCACGHSRESSAGLYYIIGSARSGASEHVGERGIHEMAHVTQMSRGEYFPDWLKEGGAVQLECLLRKKLSWITSTYEDCFKNGGGRSGIIGNFLNYYASSYGKANGLQKGEGRECGDFVPANSDSAATMKAGGLTTTWDLHYDTGAVAIAWVIAKANISSKQFWQSDVAGKGFWNAVTPWAGYKYDVGHQGECPDDKGWKKALLDITGHPCMAAFYAEFDVWAAKATAADVVAILEAQCDVDAQTAEVFDLSTAKSGSSIDPCDTVYNATIARAAAAASPVTCDTYATYKAKYEAAANTYAWNSLCPPPPPPPLTPPPSNAVNNHAAGLAGILVALVATIFNML